MEVLKIETQRDGYSIEQTLDLCRTLTVGDLIDILSQYDRDMPVVTSHDNGYTFGHMWEGDFDTVSSDSYEFKN